MITLPQDLLLPIFKYVDNKLMLRELNKKYKNIFEDKFSILYFSNFDDNNTIYYLDELIGYDFYHIIDNNVLQINDYYNETNICIYLFKLLPGSH